VDPSTAGAKGSEYKPDACNETPAGQAFSVLISLTGIIFTGWQLNPPLAASFFFLILSDSFSCRYILSIRS
jgi:hypothetical protein